MKIIIKNYIAKTILGVYPEEKIKPREILVNLVIYFDGNLAAENDDLNSTIDYDLIGELIDTLTWQKKYDLIETLVVKIGNELLNKFALIKQVKVNIVKPKILNKAESVAVEEIFSRI